MNKWMIWEEVFHPYFWFNTQIIQSTNSVSFGIVPCDSGKNGPNHWHVLACFVRSKGHDQVVVFSKGLKIWANYNDVSRRVVTLNGGLIRELPQNSLNSGLGIILICPGRCLDLRDMNLAW